MARIFSGIQPSGELHIGNWLGAVQNWVTLQQSYDCIYCVVDLHAITGQYDQATLSQRTRDMAIGLLASGIDPGRAVLFVQSHVPEHSELAWILSTVAPYGEMSRMTQFKEKSEREPENINAGLMSYPILMAADILPYRATRVPVGADQVKHLELTREICRRFNGRFGDVFPEPQPLHTKALKILGLDGKQKMSKSLGNSVQVCDEPDDIRKKIKNAFTDPTRLKKTDPGHPEACYVCSLQGYFAPPDEVAKYHDNCRNAAWGCVDSKKALAENMVKYLAPIREKAAEWKAHPERIRQVLGDGAQTARVLAHDTMEKVRGVLGLYA